MPPDKILKACVFNPEKFYIPMGIPESGDWLQSHQETGQTYDQYIAYKKAKIGSFGKTTLYFLPFQSPKPEIIAKCIDFCHAFFYGVTVKLMAPVDIKKTTVANRINGGKLQYHAMQIIATAKKFFEKDAFATLSIMMDDLYPFDDWNFCYGWGEYKGGSGVFSLARYDPRFYGAEVKGNVDDIILNRACKIMTHEMTHMFGIWHCIYFKCAMNGINNEEEAAKSPLDLCPVCLRKLQSNIGFNPLVRYEKMLEVLSTFPDTFEKDRDWIKSRVEYLKSIK